MMGQMDLIQQIRHDGMKKYGFGTDVMKTIKVCASCGAMMNVSQKFCKECGTRLPKDNLFESYQKKHKNCFVCGTVVAENTHYCPRCGQRLEEERYGK